MLSKEEAVAVLKKEGYNVNLDNGIVILYYTTPKEYKELSLNIREKLKDIGYIQSFGIRSIKNKSGYFAQTEQVNNNN